MALDRWDRDRGIHYFEYDQPEPSPGMVDAFTVARAFIWVSDRHIALGIVMVIDGLELYRVKSADVIAMARDRLSRMLEDIPGTHYEEAKGLKENTTYVYDWGGKLIRRVLP
jgi:hypothetical protein